MVRLPGLGPESAIARWVERVSGGRLTPAATRVATMAAGLALALGLVAMLVMVQASSTPTFCGTCHIMKPYYESWKHSKHNRIACVECHISPGVTAEIRKKYEALSMVAKYFTGTYSQNPWAEVDDAACLKCHERRLLEGREEFHSVIFDHRPHLTETRRGMKLRCTSCHSQIVQGTHIAVTSSTCALCHFMNQKPNEGTAACQKCHEIPDKVVGPANAAFDHGSVKRLGMDCRSCHAGVVRGNGSVPRERCVTCHNQPARLAEFANRELMHRKHVTEHKVDCMNCHLVIEHGKLPPTTTAASHTGDAGTCGACHGSGHSPQQLLYEGRGGRGVKDAPGPMYLAGVTCEGCHNASLGTQTAATAAMGVHSVKANDVSCMSCHGPEYRPIFQAWKSETEARTAALRHQLDATIGAMGVTPPPAFDDALHNFRMVERGHGVHNVNYSYALLDAAFDQMNRARSSKGMAKLERPWKVIAPGSGDCMNCHAGIERQAGRFGTHAFSHAPHLADAKLDCAACHRPHAERAPGEVVRFAAAGCVPCHHGPQSATDLACVKCHGDPAQLKVMSYRGEFSHAAHLEQGLECSTCHAMKNGDPRPPKSACEQCHGE